VIETEQEAYAMKQQNRLHIALMISVLAPMPALAQDVGRADGLRVVPDVPEQFRALTPRPEAMGFHIGVSPDPSSCKHYQGIARVDAPDGTPYFIVTRSGNTPDLGLDVWDSSDAACDDSDGESGKGTLIAVRMGSRDTNGERLRSNRLAHGLTITSTPPDASDTAVMHFQFDGRFGLPNYGHPGGMQVVGHVLAVALEHSYDPVFPRSAVAFFDVSNPEFPVLQSVFSTEREMRGKTGAVGVTPLPNDRYLMVAAGAGGEEFFFYRSTGTDLNSRHLSWEFLGTAPGPSVKDPHQTLQFLRGGRSVDGPLYLAGARGKFGKDRDALDLYQVTCDTEDCNPGEQIHLSVVVQGQSVDPYPTIGIGQARLANLAAASTFYVSPSGELIFYATEHDNDGPGGTVKMGEWRHREIVREHSPTTSPTAAVGGPYTVDEGSTVHLSGLARPPITKAWIQLYSDTGFRGYSLVVDHDDRHADNFRTLEQLDPTPPSWAGFANNAASWRWFAPSGCSIRAMDRTVGQYRPERTLTGGQGADRDLKRVPDDPGLANMFQVVDGVFFDCDQYYDGPFDLHWDLDRNGTFTATGNAVTFDAVGPIDGPATLTIPVEARHPLGGARGRATATVAVRNVAPRVTRFDISDGTGRLLNASQFPGMQTPLVVTNLPVFVEADFVDRGVTDHQTAMIEWGDGSVDLHASLSRFADAFGGATGNAGHVHRYTTPGTWRIALTVRDDDGGAGGRSATVTVVSPAQAVEQVIGRLDVLIAGATNADQQALQLARQTLAGTGKSGSNGALAMIRNGSNDAAMTLVRQAIAALHGLQAPVEPVIALLQQVISSLDPRAA
jgi:hypothetical protein